MKGTEFDFVCVHLLYFKCVKINPNRGGSYIDTPNWIRNKKASINPISTKDNKCFQYTVTLPLNYKKLKKDPQRMTKIKPFIGKYSSVGINSPSELEENKEKLYIDSSKFYHVQVKYNIPC